MTLALQGPQIILVPEINFRRTPVTLILAAVIVALEVVCTFDPPRREFYATDMKLGMLSTIWAGELWRPFTTTLLHADFLHAGFNTYWLVIFGSALEPRFRSARFLGLIVLLAYVSMLPGFIYNNLDTPLSAQVGSVGFSGVGYGLFGLLWIGRRWKHELYAVCTDMTVWLFVGWFFLCIVLTRGGALPIDNIAHGVGCLFGVLYGLAIFDVRRRLRWIPLSCFASSLVLSTLIYCPGYPGYEHHRRGRVRVEHVDKARHETALLDCTMALRGRRESPEATAAEGHRTPPGIHALAER